VNNFLKKCLKVLFLGDFYAKNRVLKFNSIVEIEPKYSTPM
jgi:hypothetical protein